MPGGNCTVKYYSALGVARRVAANNKRVKQSVDTTADPSWFGQSTHSKIVLQYSENNVKDILLDIYNTHCDILKDSIRQKVYLKFANEIQDTNVLVHYKDTALKNIVVRNKKLGELFTTCS